MKFIRDIINEKRNTGPVSASMPAEENQLDFAPEYEAAETSPAALNLGQYLETSGTDLPGDDDLTPGHDDDQYGAGTWDDDAWDEEDETSFADDSEDEMTLEAARRAVTEALDADTEPQSDDPMDRLFSERHLAGDNEEMTLEEEATSDDWEAYEDETENGPATSLASLAEMRRAMVSDRPAARAIPTAPGTAPEPKAVTESDSADLLEMPAPTPGRTAQSSGRVKTRLLGFATDSDTALDPIEKAARSGQARFPVAWMVVVSGPGRGASFTLQDGVSRIGRADDQTVALNFGDNAISRENHVSVAYDAEQNSFFIGHSGKANLVRLNDKPLLSTETISNGDLIRIGETTLRLVTLCGEAFSWNDEDQKDARYA
ncbi:FHA domain-containing protein [uncultured Roseobacter sp.]|uniref:FHA domain-containing protein n=1 Tax=uncultured Roseobacter sp. TaxID=114847 RepID=UPI002619580B|nr:FHA domain-containing protein [uncultured Roseobacter sp.]